VAISFLKINVPDLPPPVAKIQTERFYLDKISESSESLPYIFIDFLWVESIISLGLQRTQNIIDSLYSEYSHLFDKFCFINQHISAEKLDWKSGIVFSCHANESNGFLSIPHKPQVYCSESSRDKKYFGSFVGSFETHYTRQILSNLVFEKEVLVTNTGGWHFYDRSLDREDNYRKVLSESVFSFCPRGTGHGTIRLFEAFKSGTIPVIISDGYKLPPGVKDGKNCILVKEKDTLKIPKILSRLDAETVKEMLENVKDYSRKYLCFDNFEISVLEQIS